MSGFDTSQPSAYSTPTLFSPGDEATAFDSSSDNPVLMHSRSSKANSTDYDFAQNSFSPADNSVNTYPISSGNFGENDPQTNGAMFYQSSNYADERQLISDISLASGGILNQQPIALTICNQNSVNRNSQTENNKNKLYEDSSYMNSFKLYESSDIYTPFIDQYCNTNVNDRSLEFNNGNVMGNMLPNSCMTSDIITQNNSLNYTNSNNMNNDNMFYTQPSYQIPSSYQMNYCNAQRYECNNQQGTGMVNYDNFKQLKRSYSSDSNIMMQNSNGYDESLLKRSNRNICISENCLDKQSVRKNTSSNPSNTSNRSYQQKSSRSEKKIQLIRLLNLIEPGSRRGVHLCLENDPVLFKSICINRRGMYDNNEVSNIQLTLKDIRIWSDLYACKTEMIATNSGRRLFPSLSVNVAGLNPKDDYIFFLDLVMLKPHVFKHHCGNWVVAGSTEEYPPTQFACPRIYLQDESPKSGQYWMESGVNFTRAKITNSKEAKPEQNMMYVYSMHYYVPRIHIVKDHSKSMKMDMNNFELIGSFIIPGTQFYTVTAYQNPDVIRVKIKNNPFAKGFRNRQSEQDQEDLQLIANSYNQQNRSQYGMTEQLKTSVRGKQQSSMLNLNVPSIAQNNELFASCAGKPIDFSISSSAL